MSKLECVERLLKKRIAKLKAQMRPLPIFRNHRANPDRVELYFELQGLITALNIVRRCK